MILNIINYHFRLFVATLPLKCSFSSETNIRLYIFPFNFRVKEQKTLSYSAGLM